MTDAICRTARVPAALTRGLRLILLVLLMPAAAFAGERGYLGFGIAVDGEGFFENPIPVAVTIDRVTPGSPAAAAGLVVGDRIVEIEGRQVKGAYARDLKPYLEREVGQAVRLVIQKDSGELKPVTLVAAPKVEQ
jgi:C-terminal processing protease CtpA/Prc